MQNNNHNPNTSTARTNRRDFLKRAGTATAISALAGISLPSVHAAGDSTIRVALVGCGGRGTGAAADALTVGGAVKLYALADLLETKPSATLSILKQQFGDKVDVAQERLFAGFEAYKHAMDALRPGDIVILTTPLAFRWVHFTYAIAKGLNVFMEKPLTADGPTSRRMLKLASEASAKNLKVGVGLMSRHSRALQELHQRIEDGELGEIILMRGYRMHGPVGYFSSLTKPDGISELFYQIQRFHSFLWASGGNFSDFYIHIIDHLCWMKNAWPVKAQALGGRHYRQTPEGISYIDQNLDTYSVEYTFADGAKLFFDGRCMTGCNDLFASFVHGSKRMAIASKYADCGLPSAIFKGQNPVSSDQLWTSTVAPEDQNPYHNEWKDLMEAIRNDRPYNEVSRGVQASVVTSMGRIAAHTGQEMTYDNVLNSDHEYAPEVDKLTLDSPAPLRADARGAYPVPQPGITTRREY